MHHTPVLHNTCNTLQPVPLKAGFPETQTHTRSHGTLCLFTGWLALCSLPRSGPLCTGWILAGISMHRGRQTAALAIDRSHHITGGGRDTEANHCRCSNHTLLKAKGTNKARPGHRVPNSQRHGQLHRKHSCRIFPKEAA